MKHICVSTGSVDMPRQERERTNDGNTDQDSANGLARLSEVVVAVGRLDHRSGVLLLRGVDEVRRQRGKERDQRTMGDLGSTYLRTLVSFLRLICGGRMSVRRSAVRPAGLRATRGRGCADRVLTTCIAKGTSHEAEARTLPKCNLCHSQRVKQNAAEREGLSALYSAARFPSPGRRFVDQKLQAECVARAERATRLLRSKRTREVRARFKRRGALRAVRQST